jgi:hypothetical protein
VAVYVQTVKVYVKQAVYVLDRTYIITCVELVLSPT